MSDDLVQRVRRRLLEMPDDLEAAIRAEAGGIVDDAVLAQLRLSIRAQLAGLGPLEPLFALPGLTDVLVNGPRSVWIDRGAGLERASVGFDDEAAVRSLAQRLVSSAGRRLDDAAPFADAVLPDGTRLHAVLPPLTECATISLRVFGRQRRELTDLVGSGALDPLAGAVLRAVMAARLAFVISGGTGSGKTTLLGCLLGLVPADHRIVAVEDAAELTVAHPHVVRLTARPPNVEGAGAVDLRDLVRQALRMRPDRIVVGEFRGAEVADLLVALNTGHDGGAATVHANTAAAVPARLEALGMLAGLGAETIARLASTALQVVVHVERSGGVRRVAELAVLLRDDDGRLQVVPAWTHAGGCSSGSALLAGLLDDRGVDAPLELR